MFPLKVPRTFAVLLAAVSDLKNHSELDVFPVQYGEYGKLFKTNNSSGL